jgi:hypothetical protein
VSITRNPASGGRGARKNDLLGSPIYPENKQPLEFLQAKHLERRFRLSPTRAKLIAHLAFEVRT